MSSGFSILQANRWGGIEIARIAKQIDPKVKIVFGGVSATIELVDKKEFYPLHSDFCSRLGMTFDHGDYSGIDAIKNKDKIAARLYQKALQYHLNARAYLGLGIFNQKKQAYATSVEILSQGLEYFPDDEQLNICMAVSLMNTGAYQEALSYLLKFQHLQQALGLITNCYHALHDFEKAAAFQNRKKNHF